MSASDFLDGKITRKHLAGSVPIELATKKKPSRKPERCELTITRIQVTRDTKCDEEKRGGRKPAPAKKRAPAKNR